MKKFEEIIVTYHSDDIIPYPEYKGKPYFSIKYEENGEHHVGYGTYNPQVISNYIKDYFNGRASMVEEFEKLEAEFEKIEYFDYDCNSLILPALQVYDIIDNRIEELKGDNKMENEYKLGNCPRCQKTDLVITDKKVICKSCGDWAWIEDAYNSSWLKDISEEINNE